MAGRRKYFHVADSVADESWSNDELACLIRLMARMNTRWARNDLTPEEACTIQLGPTEMMAISGKRRADVAAMSVRHLADIASMSTRYLGDVVEITWPKFAEFQNYANRSRPQRGHSASASASASADRRESAPSAPAADAAPRARRKSPRTTCPDDLEPEQRDRIQRWAEGEGIALDSLDAEWAAMRDHWRGKGEVRADWEASFRTWLRRSRDFAKRDQRESSESPAQAKQRRINENAREAFRQMSGEDWSDDSPTLLALPGGRT